MFCEDEVDVAVWRQMCDAYPHCDTYVMDLFVWCYIHKKEQYLELLEKHKTYSPKVDMVQIMDDAVMRDLLTTEKKEAKE